MNMTLGCFLSAELAFMTIKRGSSEIWSAKLKVLYNRHRVTEGTEVTQCYGGADGTKSNGGVVYRFLITILG